MPLPPQTSDDPGQPEKAPWVARLVAGPMALVRWSAQSRTRSLIVGGGLFVVFVVTTGTSWYWLRRVAEREERINLPNALEHLDAGEYEHARNIAGLMRERSSLPPGELGGPAFVIGATIAYEATQQWNDTERPKYYLVAARYLEEARSLGFPHGRRGEGMFLLGKSLNRSGQFDKSIPVLRASLTDYPEKSTEIHRMLTESHLRLPNPDFKEALLHNTAVVADKQLPPAEKSAAQLTRGRILLRMGRLKDSREAISQVNDAGEHAAAKLLHQGHLLLREGDRLLDQGGTGDARQPADEKFRQAIQRFDRVQAADEDGQYSGSAIYLTGEAQRRLGDLKAARVTLMRARKRYLKTPLGLAAALSEAEVLRDLGDDEGAILAYQRAVFHLNSPDRFSNPWFSLREFRRRLVGAVTHYQDAAHYETAVTLSRWLTPLLAKWQAVKLRAETQEGWARHLMAEAQKLPNAKAEPMVRRARRELRRAGRNYDELAELRRATRDYLDHLWKSAESFLEGRDYTAAAKVLRKYLAHESRARRPRALVALADAYLSLGEIDHALDACQECIQFHPRHPATYQARLKAAQAYLEQDELEPAKKLLQANIHHDALRPTSVEWKDSLFALGNLLYRQGRHWMTISREEARDGVDAKSGTDALEKSHGAFQRAIERLSEAVDRYPDDPQATLARYRIAQAFRESSKLPSKKLKSVTIEATRAALNRQRREYLDTAYQRFDRLMTLLNRESERRELSELETAILRNCYFAKGSVLFDMRRYEDAIAAYSTATNRYQNRPEALEAFVQIAACHRRLNRPVEARAILAQAKIVLDRIGDKDYRKTTRYSQAEWRRVLAWLANL